MPYPSPWYLVLIAKKTISLNPLFLKSLKVVAPINYFLSLIITRLKWSLSRIVLSMCYLDILGKHLEKSYFNENIFLRDGFS